jgi:hypothetical protein
MYTTSGISVQVTDLLRVRDIGRRIVRVAFMVASVFVYMIH